MGTGPQAICHLPPGLLILLNSSLGLEVEDPGVPRSQSRWARGGDPQAPEVRQASVRLCWLEAHRGRGY